MDNLKGLKIAILVANGFQQIEMTGPKEALEKVGAFAKIVSPEDKKVKGFKGKEWGDEFPVDVNLEKAQAQDFDGLVLPGGSLSPDTLRENATAVNFVKDFIKLQKPIAVICRGSLPLISAGAVKGKKMTSWPSIKEDLIKAGALWEDNAVVKDGNMISSRNPNDVPVFSKAMLELFSNCCNQ